MLIAAGFEQFEHRDSHVSSAAANPSNLDSSVFILPPTLVLPPCLQRQECIAEERPFSLSLCSK